MADDDDIARKLSTEGYVVLKGYFPPSILETVTRGVDALVDAHAASLLATGQANSPRRGDSLATRLASIYQQAGGASSAPLLFRPELHHHQEFFALFGYSPLLDLMERLMGLDDHGGIRLFPNYSLRPKMPNSGAHNVAWHQDAGLSPDGSPNETPVEGRLSSFGGMNCINCWTPLVPATVETGCMRFVPGSHRFGIQRHVKVGMYRDGADTRQPVSALGIKVGVFNTQIDPVVMEVHERNAVPVPADPGDLVLFSNLMFHSGLPNTSSIVRWSLDWRYQNAALPTHRPEQGHLVPPPRAGGHAGLVMATPQQWGAALLC